MTAEPYVPPRIGFVRAEMHIGDGLWRKLTEAEFGRFIAKIKAESWAEGCEAGCSSPYGTATPSGKPYDPEPNPYRIEAGEER